MNIRNTKRLYRNLCIIFAPLILGSFIVVVGPRPIVKTASALNCSPISNPDCPGDCTIQYNQGNYSGDAPTLYWTGTDSSGAQPWNQTGYYYQTILFQTKGGDSNAPAGTIVASYNCGGVNNDTVSASNPGAGNNVVWNDSGTAVSPDDAMLGVPSVPQTNYGAWQAPLGPATGCVAQFPSDPVIQRCNDHASGNGRGSWDARLDDGADVGINGNQLWCLDVNLGGGSPCQDNLSSPLSSFSGAGFLFTSDSGWLGSGSTLAANGNTYTNTGSNVNDLIPYIGLNGSGNLNDFQLDMVVENTQNGAFYTQSLVTFKYLIPGSSCGSSCCGSNCGGGPTYSVQNDRVSGLNPNYDSVSMPAGCGSMGDNGPGSLTNANPVNYTGLTGNTTTFIDGDTVGAPIQCADGHQYTLQGYTVCANAAGNACHDAQSITPSNSVTLSNNNGTYDLWWHYKTSPPPGYQCYAAIVTNPADGIPEPGEPFTLQMSFSQVSGYAPGPYPYSININIPGMYTGPGPSGTLQPNGSATPTQTITAPGPGSYSGYYTVTINGSTVSCYYASGGPGGGGPPTTTPPITVTVADKPYLKVYGGDVLVGAGLPSGSTCATDSSAGISTYSDDNGQGASVQYGAQVLSIVEGHGFTSATGAPGALAQPMGLTFSNQTGNDGGQFGTSGLATSCAQDFVNDAKNDTNAMNPGSSIGPINLPSGQVQDSHQLYFTPNTGSKVVITKDIKYVGGPRNSTQDIPSFVLIVQGDIYIDSSVQELDGIYIATGNIYTCTNGGSLWSTADDSLYQHCQNKLTVNGAFIAKQVKFLRTNGTLSKAPQGSPGTPPGSQLGFRWSSNGTVGGDQCLQISEADDPFTWNDNYLCWPPSSPVANFGLQWDSAGTISGDNCLQINQPFAPPQYTWSDNYLCWPPSSPATNAGLCWTWSLGFLDACHNYLGQALSPATLYCTLINEPAEPPTDGWENSDLCEPLASPGTPPTSSIEPSSSPNIAEVFNYSPEVWLANNGLTNSSSGGSIQYDSITSLPPVL